MLTHNCWRKSSKSCCVKRANQVMEVMVEMEVASDNLHLNMVLHNLNMAHLNNHKLALLEFSSKTPSLPFKSLNIALNQLKLQAVDMLLHQEAIQLHQVVLPHHQTTEHLHNHQALMAPLQPAVIQLPLHHAQAATMEHLSKLEKLKKSPHTINYDRLPAILPDMNYYLTITLLLKRRCRKISSNI
mgnify:CR=1 FL=1